jgi:hypothetical protein
MSVAKDKTLVASHNAGQEGGAPAQDGHPEGFSGRESVDE